MELIFIICLFITFILCCITYKNYKLNEELKKENNKLIANNAKLFTEQSNYICDISAKKGEVQILSDKISQLTAEMSHYHKSIEDMRSLSDTAHNEYEKNLERQYQEIEQEYDSLLKSLYATYEEEQDGLMDQIKEEFDKLEYLRTTRASVIKAQLKEKEIKENKAFYGLQPTENEKDDIQALERVKPKLHQPRILCMLIWSTYFQKPMTTLCNNVLGTAIVTGVYKITNQETGECYIGQAVDVAKRWKDHAKCGLGIDTPANNKLYKAIQEYGIWNFSWELLEECSKEQLNEKENFYIELYDSCAYGYNSNIGIKKS